MVAPGGCHRIGFVLWKVYFHMMFRVFFRICLFKNKTFAFLSPQEASGCVEWKRSPLSWDEEERTEGRKALSALPADQGMKAVFMSDLTSPSMLFVTSTVTTTPQGKLLSLCTIP